MADTPEVEDKNQLNPTPKGGKKVHSRPVKIGFLDVEEGKFLKKVFKNKFCLLTDANELEWFKKQEDQVERKVQGSVKEMHHCTVDEVDEDYLGSSCCFSVTVNGKTSIFGAANAQERTNWMVEILKLRSIQDIIDLLNNPRLSRHAAYALCNQAGNKKDDIQTTIVTLGGVDGLISIVNECLLSNQSSAESDDLMKSIYYAIQKLAENEKNKKRIGKHMAHFLDVLVSENRPDIWRNFAAQCVFKCIEKNDVNIKLLKSTDGVTKLARTIKSGAKENILQEVCKSLSLLTEEEEDRQFLGRHLDVLIDVLGPAPDSIKISIIQIITNLFKSESVVSDVLRASSLVPALIPLLVSPSKNVQESASALVLLLSRYPVKKSSALLPLCLPNLIKCATSPSLTAAHTALTAIESFLSDQENVVGLGRLESQDVTLLISGLGREEIEILGPLTSIFLILSYNDTSRADVAGREEALTRSLLEGFFKAKGASQHPEIVEHSLESLANFCVLGLPQLQMCRHGLLAQLIDVFQAGDLPPSTTRSVVRTISYCSQFPYVVKDLGHCAKGLCGVLTSVSEEDILERAASALADLARMDINAEFIGDSGGVTAMENILVTTDSLPVTYQLLRAIANVCFEPKAETKVGERGIRKLTQLIGYSYPIEVRREAARALQNISLNSKNLAFIDLSLLDASLKDGDAEVTGMIAQVVRNILSASASEEISADIRTRSHEIFSTLFDYVKHDVDFVAENVLWALSYVAANGLRDVIGLGGIPMFVSSVMSKNAVIGEHCATIVDNILIGGGDVSDLWSHMVWDRFVLSFSVQNVKILEKLSSSMCSCARIATRDDQRAKVVSALKIIGSLLRFPNQSIHHSISESIVLAARDKDGSIPITDVGGLLSNLSTSAESCKMKQAGEWRVAVGAAASANSFTLTATASPSVSFQFEQEDQARVALADSLLLSVFGGQKITFADVKSEELEDDSASQRPAFSIGGARKLPTKTPRGGGVWGRTLGKGNDRADKVYQHHLLVVAEYLSTCDKRIQDNKRSVVGYLRSARTKFRPPLDFHYQDGTDAPSRMVSDLGQDSVGVENEYFVYTTFQAAGPSSLYRTGLSIADKPLPRGLRHGSPFSYFEVFVTSKCLPGAGCIGVGLCSGDYPRDQQVGWAVNGYGYHSDDGNKYTVGKNELFGSQYCQFDVVGCGIDLVAEKIFFTKNGQFIGIAFDLPGDSPDLFPCVGLSGPEMRVFVNFGQFPFLFDFNFFNSLEFSPVPKSVPGGRAPDINAEDIGREHPYLRAFETLSRNWSFVNAPLSSLLDQTSEYIHSRLGPPTVTPRSSPLPLPPPPAPLPSTSSSFSGSFSSSSSSSLPSPLIGSKREMSGDVDPNRPVWGARGASGGAARGNRLNSGRK